MKLAVCVAMVCSSTKVGRLLLDNPRRPHGFGDGGPQPVPVVFPAPHHRSLPWDPSNKTEAKPMAQPRLWPRSMSSPHGPGRLGPMTSTRRHCCYGSPGSPLRNPPPLPGPCAASASASLRRLPAAEFLQQRRFLQIEFRDDPQVPKGPCFRSHWIVVETDDVTPLEIGHCTSKCHRASHMMRARPGVVSASLFADVFVTKAKGIIVSTQPFLEDRFL